MTALGLVPASYLVRCGSWWVTLKDRMRCGRPMGSVGRIGLSVVPGKMVP